MVLNHTARWWLDGHISWPSYRLIWITLTVAVPGFVARHPLVGLVLFYEFPPWPWLSLVLIGLVLGWTWLQTHRRDPAAGARLLAALTALGVVLLVAFVVYDWWAGTPVRIGLA